VTGKHKLHDLNNIIVTPQTKFWEGI